MLAKLKKFFGIDCLYQFERGDISTFFTVLNTVVIVSGHNGAVVGLPVNIIGLIWDLFDKPHVNQVFMRLSLIVMNVYFLSLL